MKHKSLFSLILLLFTLSQAYAQNKIVIDAKSAGGYLNEYFDIGEFGFAMAFSQIDATNIQTSKKEQRATSIQYFSKDLTKRAYIKINAEGILKMYGNSKFLFLEDRVDNKYTLYLFDYTGRQLGKKKFNIGNVGLSVDMIEKTHFTINGEMLFEVYDGRGELHLFKIPLQDPAETNLVEVDLARPSSDPLKELSSKGDWKFLGQVMGFYITARKGANSDIDPNAIAYHLAFYDEEFQLFRELLLDNFLLPGVQMLGKEASMSLNPAMQSFVVSALITRGTNPGVMIANYGMNAENNVMTRFWHKEYSIKNNQKYKLVEIDGSTVPTPPVIMHRGSQVIVSVEKNRHADNEEVLNQLIALDMQGNESINEVQLGNYDMLNLDNFCVDNDNQYSRIKKMQIAAVLKPYCETTDSEVIDIDLDASGNELLIIKKGLGKKEQITIMRFAKSK